MSALDAERAAERALTEATRKLVLAARAWRASRSKRVKGKFTAAAQNLLAAIDAYDAAQLALKAAEDAR